MIKNEKTFTDENGNSQLVAYTIIERINDEVIARDWDIETNQEVERPATADEIDQIETHDKLLEQDQAAELIQQAKQSSNKEIAMLAEAFEKLIS